MWAASIHCGEPMTRTATERSRVHAAHCGRVQAKNRIGAPLGDRVLSTKYTDQETELLYYGLRFYNPGMGRWLSREPMGERASLNLLSFCYNTPLDFYDYLGREPQPVNPATRIRGRARAAAHSAGRIRRTARIEYCGLVCRTPQCVVYTTETTGNRGSCIPSRASCDSGDQRIGTWHTQPTSGKFSQHVNADPRQRGSDVTSHRRGEVDYMSHDGRTLEMSDDESGYPVFSDVTSPGNPIPVDYMDAVETD